MRRGIRCQTGSPVCAASAVFTAQIRFFSASRPLMAAILVEIAGFLGKCGAHQGQGDVEARRNGAGQAGIEFGAQVHFGQTKMPGMSRPAS